MAKYKVDTTESEIEAALERSKVLDLEPLAQIITHIPELNLLVLELSNGRRLVLPVEDVEGLAGATHEQIQNCELLGEGTGISFPDLDVDFYVPALLEGVYGSRRWMARLGSRSGKAKTAATRLASQTTRGKGGRPKMGAVAKALP